MASLMTKTLVKNHGLWAESEYATLLPQSSPEPQQSANVLFGADGSFECPACGATGEHSRRMLKKAVQQGRSRRKHRRRSLWATLRMLSRRERRWRTFSASCKTLRFQSRLHFCYMTVDFDLAEDRF